MSRITIEIDINDYIDLLDDRRREVKENFGWTIPDGVYDYFCEMLEEGIAPSDPHPRSVIDNIAVNGDYGPIENYDLLNDLLSCAEEKYLKESGVNEFIQWLDDMEEKVEQELLDVQNRIIEFEELTKETRDYFNEWLENENVLADYIKENKEELIEGSEIRDELFFTYDEEDSKYGIGVCYSL